MQGNLKTVSKVNVNDTYLISKKKRKENNKKD